MVMHARKQPRLNDGYADRKDVSHLHQNMQYQSKGYTRSSTYDRYEEDNTSDRLRPTDDGSPDSRRSSPRYYNKSTYNDRYKEKRKTPYEKKGNSLMSVAASIRSGNGSYHTRDRLQPSKYVSSSSSYRDTRETSREPTREYSRDRERDTSREYNRDTREPARDTTRESRQSEPKEKDHKTEVQKTAIRVCGDWSEHISSSGKRYFYHCKTEVSQWERPKDWIESPKTPESTRSKDGRVPVKSYTSSARSVDDRLKHSGDTRYDKTRSSSSCNTDSYKTTPDVIFVDKYKDNTNTVSHTYHRSNSSSSDHYYKDSYSDSTRKNSSHPYAMVDPSRVRNRHDSDSRLTPLSHGHKNNHSGHEDMEISPGNTSTVTKTPTTSSSSGYYPTTSRLAPLTGGLQSNHIIPHSTNSTSLSTSTQPKQQDNIKEIALQTLQKLQAALNLQIEWTQNMTQNGPSQKDELRVSPNTHPDLSQQQLLQLASLQSSNSGAGSTLPLTITTASGIGTPLVHTDHQNGAGGASPMSELSENGSCHSPANSTTSSQNAPVNTSALSGAGFSKKDQSAELQSTFSNYYNEKLIGHVMGWQADLAEREAKRYWQEALTVGSHHCSQISVELTKARSLVRVAEIESTLHEQRILFLDKQIAEIENLKPPSSILPS